MNDNQINNPPPSPDDPHCVHCHCLESMHVSVRSGLFQTFRGPEEVILLFCPDDSKQQFEPYGEADYRADEDDAREDAALARAGL